MSHGNVAPFPSAGVPVIGQPFTLANLSIPVTCTLTCNCASPASELQIIASAPVMCPCCAKTYSVAFNPQNGQLAVAVMAADQKEPS